MRQVALLLMLLGAGPARGLTLEQYFFELSDRERGAYVTGFLDFFLRDRAREEDYRDCVEELGAIGLNEAITELVENDPRLLPGDAMSWLLYEASRLCNVKAPRESLPEPPPTPEAEARAPAASAAVVGSEASKPAAEPGLDPAGAAFLAGAAGAFCGAAGAWLLARRRARLTRRDRPRSGHSPE